MAFSTPMTLSGPLRSPKQMLAEQEYANKSSIHDDETALKLGFSAGPIEGPTHFSQFAPLVNEIFGAAFLEQGCISAHYKNMVVQGEKVRAHATFDADRKLPARLWAEKEDGTTVLEASASLGPDQGPTLLEERMKKLRSPGPLVILNDLEVGMLGAKSEIVTMSPDQLLGELYPFSLRQKLKNITEPSEWYESGDHSPWGRAVIPLEMISVLTQYTSREAKFPIKGPAIGLFADLEIRLINGPLFVGDTYLLKRQIVALSESPRTESYWINTQIFDESGATLLAQVLLNHAMLKNSYERYDEERAQIVLRERLDEMSPN